MNLTDPISDMVVQIRNGLKAGHPVIDVPHSRVKTEIARILRKEGYVSDYVVEGSAKKVIRLYMRYTADHQPVIQGLRRVSKPGLRRYVSRRDIPKVLNGMGIALVTTSGGIMTDSEARKAGLGGEVLLTVW